MAARFAPSLRSITHKGGERLPIRLESGADRARRRGPAPARGAARKKRLLRGVRKHGRSIRQQWLTRNEPEPLWHVPRRRRAPNLGRGADRCRPLYYSPGACSLAPHIVLEWTGEPYEVVRVDLHHLTDEYRRINPAGAVPALDYGAPQALTQCAAVLNYLALTHPALDLLDERSPEHAATLVKWTAFLTGDLHPAFWPVFMPARYTKATDPAALENVKQAGLDLVRTKLGLLERQLQGHSWILGDKRTILDAYATPMLNWAASMLPGGLAAFPSLLAHQQRMRADPAVLRVMAAEGLPVDDEERRHEHA